MPQQNLPAADGSRHEFLGPKALAASDFTTYFLVSEPGVRGLSRAGDHDKAVVIVPMLLSLHGAVLALLVKTVLVILVMVAEHIRFWKGLYAKFRRPVWSGAVEADDVERNSGKSVCGGKGLDSSSATSRFVSSDPSKVDEKSDRRSFYFP